LLVKSAPKPPAHELFNILKVATANTRYMKP
jgi:hypothetical protein